MKYKEINNQFTKIVAGYMAMGYAINSSTMGGSEGETAKIDLTDGKEIIRILISDFTEWSDIFLSGVEIIVGWADCGEGVKPHAHDGNNIIWNNQLKIINREQFYEVGVTHREKFYGTKEEAVAAQKVRLQRYQARECATERIPAKMMEIAKRIIRREFGVKRIREADIKISRRKNAYAIGYRGAVYWLH